MMTALATVLRCSSLSWWPDCPRRSAARLFRVEIEAAGYKLRQTPTGVGSVIGTSLHGAAEFVLSRKAHSGGALPPVNDALDAARDTLQHELGRGEVDFDATSPTRSVALRQIISMTRAYCRTIAPKVDPILVEERLEAEVEPGLILSGQPDVVAREPRRIRDLKSGAKAAPGSASAQVGGYSLICRSNSIDVVEAGLDYIRRVSPDRPQPDPISTNIVVETAETAAANIVRAIAGDLKTFREGDPERRILPGDAWSFIANPQSVLCSAKYCPAHGTSFCREWQEK